MKEYEVLINGQSVDIYSDKDFDLAITLAIAEANELNVGKKANTKTLKFPATNNNKIIFGHPEMVNSVVNINQQTKPSIIIRANGTTIFQGHIKVRGATNLVGIITEYEGVCFGVNGDWISLFGESKLSDLDYSDQNHLNNWLTIANSEYGNYEYVYDLIDRGQFTGQTYDNGKIGVNIEDRFPALKIKGLVERCFKHIGYNVVSSFKDSAFFGKLYYEFTNEQLKHPDSFSDDVKAHIQSTDATHKADTTTTGSTTNRIQIDLRMKAPRTIFSNTAGAFEFRTPERYMCLGKGKYRIKSIIQFRTEMFAFYDTANTNYGNVIFTISKFNQGTDGLVYAAGGDASSDRINLPSKSYTAIVTFEKEVDLDYGDEVFIRGVVNCKQTLGGAGGERIHQLNHTFEVTEVIGELGLGENQYVDWAYNLPDVYILDFLNGLKALFNLRFTQISGLRTVYFEPRDSFYSGEIQNWTDLLDISKEMSTSFLGEGLSKTMRYRYRHDSKDELVNEWEKQNSKVFGAIDVSVNNAFAKDGVQEVENPLFAPTFMDRCERIGLQDATIPKQWNSRTMPKRSQAFEPRILYYEGLKTISNSGYWRMNWYSAASWQTAHPVTAADPYNGKRYTFPRFYSYNDLELNDNNLLYCDTFFSSGLQQKYYRNNQKIIDEGQRFSCYIKLNDVDIENIDFRKPIIIEIDGNATYFVLDEVSNYKSQDGVTTLCHFTKVIPTIPASLTAFAAGSPFKPFITSTVYGDIGALPDGTVVIGGTPFPTPTKKNTVAGGIEDVVTETSEGYILPVYTFDPLTGSYIKVYK